MFEIIPEFGHFALIVAFFLALFFGISPFFAQPQRLMFAYLVKSGTLLMSGLVTLAFACLVAAFVANDFSLGYVAAHSNSLLPLVYRVAATWGGHEGSLLLWILMLSWWSAAVTVMSGQLPALLRGRILAVLALLNAGFIGFILFTSNPFSRAFPVPGEGRDLNPMLQDPGLAFHPPMLYMGYVGFSVVFAFAIAALISGRLDTAWARWSRPWTLAAWVCLTIGIALGSSWAYYELGWGGWWFWDPVENASFMPWLAGTALLHSLIVSEKRGSFKNWTVLLAIVAFSFSLLGTFLVRSGVLTSVHAFATDPQRGIYILLFMFVVVGGSLALFAFRAPQIGLGGRFALLSRETGLLLNNVILAVAAATVCLGTLYPLLLDALNQGKISVGPPYFNLVFVPLMLPLVALMVIGPLLRWKNDQVAALWQRLRWPLGLSILSCGLMFLCIYTYYKRLPGMMGSVWLIVALTLIVGIKVDFWRRIRKSAGEGGLPEVSANMANTADMANVASTVNVASANTANTANIDTGANRPGQEHKFHRYWRALCRQPLAFWAMHTAHAGIAVFIIGVTMVGSFEVEQDLAMRAGESVQIATGELRFNGVDQLNGPNYQSWRGDFTLNESGRTSKLYPEKRRYFSSAMPMTEAAINVGVFRDIYVSMSEQLDDNRWVLRVYFKPFIDWIWAGCFLMALGGAMAIVAQTKRRKATANVVAA